MRSHFSASRQAGDATIGFHVDGGAGEELAATREVGNDLIGYLVGTASDAARLAGEMAVGRLLLLDLEGDAYAVPLDGFAAEFAVLTAACPLG